MKLGKFGTRLYYAIKPFIPRSFQIALRRRYALRTLRVVTDVWPICPGSDEKPPGWSGWPSDRTFAFILTHDVEQTRGMRRCLQLARMEKELGLVSSFNFVPEKYYLPPQIREELSRSGFEVGIHDLRHDGKLYSSEKVFLRQALIINQYLRNWNSVGFRSGSMYHNLEWLHGIRAEYDLSTFDTDPFEPQPDGICTVFPKWIVNTQGNGGYIELPYTLPQDLSLFIILQHRDTQLWENKLEWIANRGGMALLITHPDYMSWGGEKQKVDEYPVELYCEFLLHVTEKYRGQYWNALPKDVACYSKSCLVPQPNGHR